MRRQSDRQMYMDFAPKSDRKVAKQYRKKYEAIGELLDKNPAILDLVDQDIKKLSTGDKNGRKATYTSENILRAIIVHQLEGTSLRKTVIRMAESDTLRKFMKLGHRDVMDYSFLDKCFNAIQAETWKKINEALAKHAQDKKLIDPSEMRTDSTVVESNIHYPTEASLLWDCVRVLIRLLCRIRKTAPELVPHRFHEKKTKKLYLFITRYISSNSKKRQRSVKRTFRALIKQTARLHEIAEKACKAANAGAYGLETMALAEELGGYLPSISKVIDTAERVQLKGEKVPAKEKIFSIFEPHTELIKRGKRSKPVEFGHKVVISQLKQKKFISDYEVLEKQKEDSELTKSRVDRHEQQFGSAPDLVAGDCGFYGDDEEMEVLRKKVKHLAIPKSVKDWGKAGMRQAQRFRAGIEGTISVLKRAFRLVRCLYRGFKNFASAVGVGVFCHNLVCLTR